MGLKGFIRKYLKRAYKGAWDYAMPTTPDGRRPTVGILSMMQFVKTLPDDVVTVQQAVDWNVRKPRWELNGRDSPLDVLIVTADREKLDVKGLIVHTERYADVELLGKR